MNKAPGGGLSTSANGGMCTSSAGGASSALGGGLSNAPGGGMYTGPGGGLSSAPGGGLYSGPGGGLYTGPGGNLSTGPNGGLSSAPGGGMSSSSTPYLTNIPPWHIFVYELQKRGFTKEANLIINNLPSEYKNKYMSKDTNSNSIQSKPMSVIRDEYKQLKESGYFDEEEAISKKDQKKLNKLMKKFK